MASPITRIRPTGAVDRRVSLQREYVAGGTLAWYGRSKTALPWAFDDVTADFGFEIYERMRLDSQVSACITFFKAAIIEDGLTITPAVTDDKADGYELSREIANKALAMFDSMDTSFDEVLWDMLNCMIFGSKVGELIYAVEDNQLNLKKVKVKPSRSTAYVVDPYLNIIGLLADTSGVGFITGSIDPKNVLPREKFMIMSYRQEDSDPRGTSLLRAAYDAWWRKRQILPEYLKFLARFASPSVIGFTADGSTLDDKVVDDEGNEIVTPEEAMRDALLAFQNGSAAAFPGGAKVEPLEVSGDGAAFLNAIGQTNLEITKALLTQELATEEGTHMARAAARVHQDVLNTLIRQGKRNTARTVGVDILRRWVGYNWGPSKLPLTPRASLGSIEYKDMSAVMQAISSLKRSDFFVDEQLPAVDKILGLPVRTAEQMAKSKADKLAFIKASKPQPTQPAKPREPQPANPARDQRNQENGGRQPNGPARESA